MFPQCPLAQAYPFGSGGFGWGAGIAIFAWLTATLAKANEAMRRQVALKASRSRAACIGLAVAGLAHLPLVLGVWLPQHQLWRSLLLSPQQSVSSVRHSFGTFGV